MELNNLAWTLDRRRALRKNQTPAEAVLWAALRGAKVAGYKFRRQHAFGPYILDFHCPAAQVVIEVDGEVHDSEFAAEYDRVRDQFLQEHGLRVLRFRNEQVLHHLPRVVAAIEAALAP